MKSGSFYMIEGTTIVQCINDHPLLNHILSTKEIFRNILQQNPTKL